MLLTDPPTITALTPASTTPFINFSMLSSSVLVYPKSSSAFLKRTVSLVSAPIFSKGQLKTATLQFSTIVTAPSICLTTTIPLITCES